MRFLWQSNAPWAGTGYGVQTKLLLKALKELEHDPVCFAFYGLQGGTIEYDGYEVLPSSPFGEWGNDVIKTHLMRSESEAVVTLMDIFVLDPSIWSELHHWPWAAWVPIDSEELGFPQIERLKHVDFPVAMSKFGAKQMQDVGIEPSAVIYHAVDTEVFKPADIHDRMQYRRDMQADEDAFIVGMVMANKGDRKQFPTQLAAVREWMDNYPDRNIKVWLHTDPTAAMGGWDMKALVAKLGLKNKVYSTSQYETSVVPAVPELMARIYNCFDVLLNCSAGEGFGVPIIEAQACGVPVITNGGTAMDEITQYGYVCEPITKVLAPAYGYQFLPDLNKIVYRLESVYRMANKTDSLAGVEWVRNNCSVPVIANQWSQLLKIMADQGKVLYS